MRKVSSRLCLRLLNQFRSLADRVPARRPCLRSTLVTAATCALVNVVEEIAAVAARVNVRMDGVAGVGAAAVVVVVAAAHAEGTPVAREQLSWMPWLN